ncbi:PucR family transcriptional regulator [Pseudonocardia acaciae]|uniref:PucR family transcriptional regulator n=1 Tax=Pseudonocardia acaciae TaxID=551276 RepID=UPI000561B826|nr:helix-turn-helix domain-containing protein [Pseudonocardia acaciae]
MAEATAQATAQAVDLAAVVAREIEPHLGALTTEMVNIFFQVIPALRSEDEDIRELLYASSFSNVATATNVFVHSIPIDQIDLPAAAAHYTRRLAQRDVPVEALLRAYRLGEGVYLQWWFRLVERHQPDAKLLMEVVYYTAHIATAYIDRVCEHLVAVYDDERKLWTQRAAATRAVQVRTALFDEDLSASTAEAITGYRMQGEHIGLVAWSSASHSGRELESTAQVIATASGQQPLAVLADDRTLWAWVSGPTTAKVDPAALADELARRGSGVRIALGSPAVGLTGFRASHHEALNAQRVATIRGEAAPSVTAFAEVAASAFLAKDLRSARRWVSDVLGGLAVDDPGMAELRKTVLSFLRTGASLTEAATELHLHKNTVRYRLRKAEDIRGRPTAEGRVDLEIALLACEQLGQGVLIQTGL